MVARAVAPIYRTGGDKAAVQDSVWKYDVKLFEQQSDDTEGDRAGPEQGQTKSQCWICCARSAKDSCS